jgi:5-methylcytosine-specific restriction endonuclease McrA
MSTPLTPRRVRGRSIWLDPRWKKARAEAITRDQHQCRACGATTRLTVHHTTYAQPFDVGTLVTLCQSCHGKIDGPKARGGRRSRVGGVTAAGVSFQVGGEAGNRFLDTVHG